MIEIGATIDYHSANLAPGDFGIIIYIPACHYKNKEIQKYTSLNKPNNGLGFCDYKQLAGIHLLGRFTTCLASGMRFFLEIFEFKNF